MNDADAPRRERLALVRPALPLAPLTCDARVARGDLGALTPDSVLVAQVLAGGSVLDELLASAVITAAVKLGEETFDGCRL